MLSAASARKGHLMDLDEIRVKIDSIDVEIVTLLAKRADLVSAAGKLKKNEEGVRDPKRAEQVIEKVKAHAVTARLDPSIAESVYRTIISCFIRRELKEFNTRR